MTDAADAGAPAAEVVCPRCSARMQPMVLSSHRLDQPEVTVEHCAGCRLVWFDRFESVQLDARGWVRLLRGMHQAAERPLTEVAAPRLRCPSCAASLKPVQNQSRYGPFAVLECPRGHGHLHSHSGLLAERGLVRPLGVAERRALAEERHALHCLNCGGLASASDDDCRWCGTPLAVIDLPRLAHSLKPPRQSAQAAPRVLGQHTAWPCRGCGAPLDPGRDTVCSRCGHLVVAHELPDIRPLLDEAEAALAAAHQATARVHERLSAGRVLPAAAPERAPASPRLRALMLRGWLPLLVLLVLAAVVADVHGLLLSPRSAAPWTRWWALRQEQLALGALIAAFVLFCGLGRWLGARRAGRVSLLAALPLCWWAGRGEGAASVLLIGMYVAVAGIAVFTFGWLYRLYRDAVFSRFGD